MKNEFLMSLLIVGFWILNPNVGISQVTSGLATMSKPAIKGNYGGTYQLNNGNVAVFYQTSDGVYAYEFNADSKFVKEHQGAEALKVLDQVTEQSTEINNVATKEFTSMNVMFAGASWGSVKLQKGSLFINSDKNFIYGMDYKKGESEKLKAEGTWRTVPIGNRAIIPEDLKVVKFKGNNGKYMSFTFSPLGVNTMAPAAGYIQSAGIITEKISITNPPPHNSNRLVVFKVGGKTFEESNNIHIMPYAMQSLGAGISANGNFIAMTMPLYAPSSVKEHKALLAPDEDKNNLYIYEIDDNNQVVSQAIHKSELRTVNFQAVATEDKTFVVGTGKEGRNWRMFYAGQAAMSGLTVAVLDKSGKVVGSHSYLEKDLLNKYEIAGTGKGKFQKFTGGPNFYRAEKLENGNTFIFGVSDGYHHGILLSAANELIKYYVFPHADLTKHTIHTQQLEVIGNKVYLVLSDQPLALSNAVQKSTSTSSSTSGNIKTTTTSTSTSQLFEIYHVSQLFTIDGKDGKCSQLWLNNIQKNFHTLGNTPAFFGKDAIYFSGRIKAKGKDLSLVKISY
ncbi:MAG: hypothetical protein M3Q58_09880 [Bacteroidota bacterium]|nr:hypothetical protein [Bacteroidota bacterium]